MSPLLDRQRRGVELGRIRIGIQVPTAKGGMRPEKLETFRLTSPSRAKLDTAATLFGGEVREWNRGGGRIEWDLVTERAELPVRVPPGEPVTQFYEMWSGGGCERRCDGEREQLKATDCLCPPDLAARRELAALNPPRACKPRTRLQLILADLPGLGVWVLTSTGDSAADELASTAELLHAFELRGTPLPATLRLEQRESRSAGQVHRFAVPVLDVGASLAQLEAGQVPAAPVLAAPTAARQIEAGEPSPDQPTAVVLADFLDACETKADVLALHERAEAAGVLEDHVEDSEGVLTPFVDLLRDRHRALP